MLSLNLNPSDKESVQRVVEGLQKASSQEIDRVFNGLANGDRGPFQRFLLGTCNHLLTWWVGLFQLQMQHGIWGQRWRGIASTRASTFWQITSPLREEVLAALQGGDAPIISAVVRYNLRYRKADITGRLTGGFFTNYASTGGRFGNQRLSGRAKLARGFTNFGIASYGASVNAVVSGHRKLEEIIQAVVTGRPEKLPASFSCDLGAPTPEEVEMVAKVEEALSEVMSLTQAGPGPIPIREFCSRPENLRLEGVCR